MKKEAKPVLRRHAGQSHRTRKEEKKKKLANGVTWEAPNRRPVIKKESKHSQTYSWKAIAIQP